MDGMENIVVEEELETPAEEVVVEEFETTDENHSEEETSVEETSTSEDGDDVQDETTETVEITVGEKFTKNFTVELSHGDIQYALYHLIRQYDEEDNEWYYIRDVYDDYFYMQSWDSNHIYKIGYVVDGENVSLVGERQEMFELIVSESEKIAIEKMRENYAILEEKYNELVQFKTNTEAAVLQAKKDAIFADSKYTHVSATNAFKKLIAESVNYSIEECMQMADEILNDFNTYVVNFASTEEVSKPQTLSFSVDMKNTKKKIKAYGNLFD